MKLKWGDYATTINDLVDTHDTVEEEQTWVKAKLVALKDRSRRNNIKIRIIPETVQPSELRSYATAMLATLMPDLPAIELSIDSIRPSPSIDPRHL